MASAEGRQIRRRGFGPFVTRIEYEGSGGVVVRWTSRGQRKHAGPVPSGSTWWAPEARGWWIGALFALGSALFALGAVPWLAIAFGARADAIVFVVGSLFFTAAGFLQYLEVVDAGPGEPPRGWRRVLAVAPQRIDWWATVVQLAGTLFFNVSTGAATYTNLSSRTAEHHVWRPDLLGSVCFLVASALAWFEVCHGWGSWEPSSLAWWITLANLVGSVAFGVSAVAAFVVPATGELFDATLTNIGTFLGALFFLGGALLLMPERTESLAVGSAPDPSAA